MVRNEGEKKVQAAEGAGTGDGARSNDAQAAAAAEYEAACAHAAAGRITQAEAICRGILTADPSHAEALHLLGGIAHRRGQNAAAEDLLRKAIRSSPRVADYHNNLGAVLLGRGRADEAIARFEKAIELDPTLAMAHNNLGYALKRRGDLEGAAASFRRTLELRPDLAQAHSPLGAVYKALGKMDEAEESLRRAVEVKPGFAQAHSNLGLLLQELGRYDEAEESLKRAVALKPDSGPARANLARLLLVRGDFDRAWELYVARKSVRNSPRALWQKPLPGDLRGKRLLVLKDQGLGDEIFFLRFAPELKTRGAAITYLANPKIGPIIARLPFIDRVVGEDEPAFADRPAVGRPSSARRSGLREGGSRFSVGEGRRPEAVDFTLSAGDLPLAVGMKSAADIPPPYPLPVEPGRAARMATRLKRLGPPPYVGITWRAGTPNDPGAVFKLAPLEELAKLLGGVGGTFLALQRKPEAGEIEALGQRIGRPVHDFTALNDDLEDMLALLALIDEYVTVSNTNVHLRAGTGRTSRVLVPMPPEYRWMAEGDESPWFPGCRVYRQTVGGSWEAALAALARDLEQAFAGRGE